MNIDNYSIALSPENDTAIVYLAKGFYNVTILVVYQVAQNLQGDLTAAVMRFLVKCSLEVKAKSNNCCNSYSRVTLSNTPH
ncbi:MAG: hypothetical protein RXQ22_09805 [Sulfolobus sp.]